MHNTKASHLIVVRGAEYRWRAKGNDECISIGIWPTNGIGAYLGGSLGYHNTWVDTGDGIRTSAGDQIVVTSKSVERIIEYAVSQHSYDPSVKGRQLDLMTLDGVIKWDDAVRASNPQGGASERQLFSPETNRTSVAAASRRSP
jgi:hypothetical protein